MSLDLCFKQLHVVHIKGFLVLVRHFPVRHFPVLQIPPPCFLMVRHFPVLQIPATRGIQALSERPTGFLQFFDTVGLVI